LRTRRDRRPRQRRATGGGVPAVALGHLERRASGSHRRVAETGGAPSDAPVGRPRTPNLPRAVAGRRGGVLRGRSGRRRTGARRMTRPGVRLARGPGAEVREDLVDHRPLRDERDDPHRALARRTREGVHREDRLEQRRRRASAHRRLASVGARRGAGTMAGGPSAPVGAAFPRVPRVPRGRLAYQP
jgi:hypothetical protein